MSKKLHFGVYLSSVEEQCQSIIWRGISKFAHEHNIRVTVFISTYQQRIGVPRTHYGVTFDFASQTDSLDGLLFFGGTVTDGLGYNDAEKLYNQFSHLPSVNISMPYGNTTVHVDNKHGMRQVVEHLIEAHGKRRIAFIRGPIGHREADDRFDAYCETLNDADIPIDESLIWTGSFSIRGGREAVRVLLDERRTSFDAIVAADDETAIGILEILRERKLEVPRDVLVTGFDDIEMAEAHIPSITTVKQPFFELGYSGAQRLLELCETGVEQGMTVLEPTLLVRQSCGCVPTEITQSHRIEHSNLREMREFLSYSLIKSNIPNEIAEEWFELLSTYILQINSGEELFLQKFDAVLSHYRHFSSDLSIWQQVLSQFQEAMTVFFANSPARLAGINTVILKSAWLIQKTIRSEDRRVELEGSHTQWEIRGIAHDIMTAFDFNDLYGKIESGFRELELGSKGVLIALYNEPVPYNREWDSPEELNEKKKKDSGRHFIEAGKTKKCTG